MHVTPCRVALGSTGGVARLEGFIAWVVWVQHPAADTTAALAIRKRVRGWRPVPPAAICLGSNSLLCGHSSWQGAGVHRCT